jgi:hypothetical protein
MELTLKPDFSPIPISKFTKDYRAGRDSSSRVLQDNFLTVNEWSFEFHFSGFSVFRDEVLAVERLRD